MYLHSSSRFLHSGASVTERVDARAFGHALAVARDRRGWTQKDLAAASGVPLRTIASYEAEGVNAKVKTALVLADTLGVSLDQLVGRAPLYEPVEVLINGRSYVPAPDEATVLAQVAKARETRSGARARSERAQEVADEAQRAAQPVPRLPGQ